MSNMASREEIFQDLKSRLETSLAEVVQQKAVVDQAAVDASSGNQQVTAQLSQATQTKAQLDQLLIDLQAQLQLLNEGITKTSSRETDTKTVYDELQSAVDGLKTRAEEIVKQSEDQQQVISEQLKKANAVGLFHAFDTEKVEHRKSAERWGISTIATLVVITILGGLLLADSSGKLTFSNLFSSTQTGNIGLSYYLRKLAILSPLLYWLVLSTRQFSKARRLQEEYAFKSTISLSLEAYRDMLRKEAGESTTQEYVLPVLAKSVEQIFSSPTESISKHPHKEDKDMLETALEIVSTQGKVIDSIRAKL